MLKNSKVGQAGNFWTLLRTIGNVLKDKISFTFLDYCNILEYKMYKWEMQS